MDDVDVLTLYSVFYGVCIGAAIFLAGGPGYVCVAFSLIGYTISFWGSTINMSVKAYLNNRHTR